MWKALRQTLNFMKQLHPKSLFELTAFAHAALFENCTYVWEVLPKIAAYLKKQRLGKIAVDIPTGAYLIDPESIVIGKGTVVEPGAYIKGPCIIGENCVVRHGAYIRGDVIAGNRCIIGHDTEVKNALFLNGAHAAHFAYVGDSILGNNVNLGAGTKCANLKFDNGAIAVRFGDRLIETGLRKFGAVFGDGAQTGCNAVTNPGTIFGKNSACYPCTNPSGYVDENCIVKPDQKLCIHPFRSKAKV